MFETFAESFPVLVLRACGILLTLLVVASFGWLLKRFGVFTRLAEALGAFASLPKPQQAFVALFVAVLIVLGSTKVGDGSGGGTNDAPTHMSAPRRLLRSPADGWLIPSTPVTPDEIAAGWRAPADGAAGIVPAPGGAVTNERWRLRGAHDDAFRLELEDWRFPCRDGVLTGVTVLARGEVRPDVGTLYFPVPLTNGVSLLPEARWGLLPCAPEAGAQPNCGESPMGAGASQDGGLSFGCAPAPGARASVFWHALSPSNSLLLTWENALVGRDLDCPTNLQAELYADGRFAWRTDGGSRLYLPVLEFDWDGDGLENSVDPDPLVAGPDAHGTNAEWYKVVCTNVFTGATGSEPEDSDVPRLLPDGVEFRPDAFTNAYYFVDVVAEQGPAPIYFMAGQRSDLGSPVLVATPGVTNHVPLQIGIEYAVTSTVPFSVGLPMSGFAELLQDEPTRKTIKWPLEFTFTEESCRDNVRTYSVSVGPYNPGGYFSWEEPDASHGRASLMSAGRSSPECGCVSFANGVWTFCCSGSCSCNGTCEASGSYYVAGSIFGVTGGVCRCGFEDPEDDEPPTYDPQSGPSFSVSFSKSTVVFEEDYLDAGGTRQSRRSTRVRMTVSAYGGPHGAMVSAWSQNLSKLSAVGNETVDLPISRELAPGESLYETCVFEGAEASGSASDVSVTGYLIDSDTNLRMDDSAELTVVKLEVEAEADYPTEKNRRAFGPVERATIKSTPAGMARITGTLPEDIQLPSLVTPCNMKVGDEAKSFTITLTVGGETFNMPISVIHPSQECEVVSVLPLTPADWVDLRADPLVPQKAGAAGKIKVRLKPDYVSFKHISLIEGFAPATGVWGCCLDEVLYPPGSLDHGTEAGGADNYHGKGDEVEEDNTLPYDKVAFWVHQSQDFPCEGGGFTLAIPWKWYAENLPGIHDWRTAMQEIRIMPNGTVTISKNGATIRREIGGRQEWAE